MPTSQTPQGFTPELGDRQSQEASGFVDFKVQVPRHCILMAGVPPDSYVQVLPCEHQNATLFGNRVITTNALH